MFGLSLPDVATGVLALFASCIVAGSHPLDTWQVRHSGTNGLRSVIFADGQFVSVGERGVILTSRSGETWTRQDSGNSASLYGISHGNGRFLAVGTSGTIVSWVDGTNWTVETSGITSNLASVCYGNGRFVAGPLARYGFVLTSADARNWSSQAAGGYWIIVHLCLETGSSWRPALPASS
jgi:hypothetical protein